eukprot:2884651-Alexandrium_andersonii.AAC.1
MPGCKGHNLRQRWQHGSPSRRDKIACAREEVALLSGLPATKASVASRLNCSQVAVRSLMNFQARD